MKLHLRQLLLGFLVFAAPASAWVTLYPVGATLGDPQQVSPGAVIFNTNDGTSYAVLNNGTVVQQWVSPDPARPMLGYTEPLPGGTLLAYLSTGVTPGCGLNCGDRIVELDIDGNVVWDYVDSERFLHHDFERLSNGNTMVLCSVVLETSPVSDQPITDDCLVEVDPDGNVVWTWQTADHYAELGLPQETRDLIFELGGDWGHANGAGVIPDNTSVADPRFRPGNVFVTYQNANLMIVIDRDTDEVVWTSLNVVSGQHGLNFLADDVPGGGHFLVLDNGAPSGYPLIARSYSRVIEIDPTDDSIPWEYTAVDTGSPIWSFYSHFKGTAQRLPNGNTLVVEGSPGRIFELNPAKELVWEYVNPFFVDGGSDVYRAWRVAPSWPQAGPDS